MTDINTFTAAIDTVIARSGRPDRRADIISHARLTMRECQVLAWFERDLIEDQLAATADPFIWEFPQTFRQMRTVQYPGLFDPQGSPVYPEKINPGRKQRLERYYWYPTGGDSLVFYGHGGSASGAANINIAYWAYFNPLKYYASGETKPANYTIEDLAWTYPGGATTDAEKEAARAKVTNWLLFDWFDIVIEGTLAKLYKMNDDPRAASTFGLYKSLQKDLLRGASRMNMGGNV